MVIAALLFGLLVQGTLGYLVLRYIERKHPVLLWWERSLAGLLLGATLQAFVLFLLHVLFGVPWNATTFLVSSLTLIVVLFFATRRFVRGSQGVDSGYREAELWKKWQQVACGVLGVWTVCKLLSILLLATSTPTYPDDGFNNWNMRAKIFAVTQEMRLEKELGNEETSFGGVMSYPPTVPLTKVWINTLYGTWKEPLANTPHAVWLLCVIGLLYGFLRRFLTVQWSLLGVYLLCSLPLVLLHGAIPYADIYVAGHLLIATVSLVLYNKTDASTWLRLSALATGLLVFTKNETLLLHVPLLLLLTALSLYKKGSLKDGIHHIGWVAAIGLPWIVFKHLNGLTFGNAKSVAEQTISFHPEVGPAIWVNTLLEGNWALLPALFVLLLLLRWKRAFYSPLVIVSAFLLLIYAEYLFIFFFTPLASEAIWQTGYGRGMVQLMPLIVFISTILLRPKESDSF